MPAIFLLAHQRFDAAALRTAAAIYRESDPVTAEVLADESERRNHVIDVRVGRRVATDDEPQAQLLGGDQVGLHLGSHGLTSMTVDKARNLARNILALVGEPADAIDFDREDGPASEPMVHATYTGAFTTYRRQVLSEIGDLLPGPPPSAAIFEQWVEPHTPAVAALTLIAQASRKGRPA